MIFNLEFGTRAAQWNTYKECRRILSYPFPARAPLGNRTPIGPVRTDLSSRQPAGACTDAGNRKVVTMKFLGFLLLGILAGAIAKLILPGRQGGGWLVTLLLGVVGALLGGWIASLLFNVDMGSFFDLRTWVIAILGSLVVLLIYGAVTRNRSSST
jgi:uncharacterized membrane protein YeaQ/YmgE (transglycosylase-associated protein family)